MNVAVVGIGRWGKNHARTLHQLQALAAVCDTNNESLKEMRTTLPGVHATSSFEEILERADITAVAIATSAEMHYDLARRALLAGKDVLVEKPLALRSRQALELVTLAETQGRIIMVGHQLHYHPAIETMAEMMRSGELGKIYKIFSSRMNWGTFRRNENVMWSFAPHDVSLFRMFAGSDPTKVWCHGDDFDMTTPGVADATWTRMRFPNDIIGEIKVSWVNHNKEHRIVITGSKGMLVFTDSDDRDKLRLIRRRIQIVGHELKADPAVDETVIPYGDELPLAREYRHFLACLQTREQPRTNGREGLAVLRILEASQRSMDLDGEAVYPDRLILPYTADDSADVSADARIGEGTTIGAHSRIEAGAVIGKNCRIGDYVKVKSGATVGDGTSIWDYSSIDSGAVIGHSCVIGQKCMIMKNAILGNRVKLQYGIAVWGGVQLDDEVFVAQGTNFINDNTPRAGEPKGGRYISTHVEHGATLGAGSNIGAVVIGRYAVVGKGANVTKSVRPFSLVIGNPARHRDFVCMRNHGEQRFTPLQFVDGQSAACPTCKQQYIKDGNQVDFAPAEAITT